MVNFLSALHTAPAKKPIDFFEVNFLLRIAKIPFHTEVLD